MLPTICKLFFVIYQQVNKKSLICVEAVGKIAYTAGPGTFVMFNSA